MLDHEGLSQSQNYFFVTNKVPRGRNISPIALAAMYAQLIQCLSMSLCYMSFSYVLCTGFLPVVYSWWRRIWLPW